MKDLKKLKGATTISKKDQKNIKGGNILAQECYVDADCMADPGVIVVCYKGRCVFLS